MPLSSAQTDDPLQLCDHVVAGRFRVLASRHVGPSIAVYEAEPPGVGRVRRALKVLRMQEARDPHLVKRLESYVKQVRDIHHPNVERVYELGFLPDEMPFLLTEWIPYYTLERYLREQPNISMEQRFALVRQIARGLEALHLKGLPHGDLVAKHVVVLPERDQFSRVVLIDAGLRARLQCPPPRNAEGPIAYWSPERIEGHGASLASDVYALGVLTYFIFSDRLPFLPGDPQAKDAGGDPIAQVSWLHLYAKPPKLQLAQRYASIVSEMEMFLERAMAKTAAERFANASEFLMAFEDVCGATGAGRVHVPAPSPKPSKQAVQADQKQSLSTNNHFVLWCLLGILLGTLAFFVSKLI